MDVDEAIFRSRPGILAIAERLHAQGVRHRLDAAAVLADYVNLSKRTRDAILSHFPEPLPATELYCPACGGTRLDGRMRHTDERCRGAA